MRIGVFSSAGFDPLPDYTADDVDRLLRSMGLAPVVVDHAALEAATRERFDLLVFPYVRGDFSARALDALVRFHADGGSLLFLGDLPNRGAWYPLRNMQSSLLHLTRCAGGTAIDGLTEAGRRILGELEDLSFFTGRTVPALRVTAHPPDVTHDLILRQQRDQAWGSTPVVAVERFGEAFLGARFAQVAFNGGEPRETVGGGYQRPWTYDPGMLTREWKGLGPLVAKLVRWLEPVPLAGAIDVAPLHAVGAPAPLRVRLRNLTDTELSLAEVSLEAAGGLAPLFRAGDVVLPPRAVRVLDVPLAARPFGIHAYRLRVTHRGAGIELASVTERVYPDDASRHPGFGASTFWAFPTPRVTDDFRDFCRELLKRGCQYLRVNIPWEDVEPEPGRYDWSLPDQMIAFAAQEGFELFFWMFPTTRCSGLGDSGVPLWTLKEPAIDRDGNPGYFPSLWSPFYRKRYAAMLDAFTKRYAQARPLRRFILDFGNSDFPYGYYYYVNDPTLFDYSPHEREAFARYLREERGFSLEQVGRLMGTAYVSWGDVPVPPAARADAWRVYLQFREYSLLDGLGMVERIVEVNAPDKAPPDPPGHGLGSIADLTAYLCESKARHWDEERAFDPRYTRLASTGREWGGEAWQVGARFAEYDDALFQSVRLNATYCSIPGPDLGVYGDDLARVGFIRRTIMGATRRAPEFAVMDRLGWNEPASLAHVATRLDQPVDLLSAKHRYDFSCYRLLAMPADEMQDRIVTGGQGAMLVPSDEGWYRLLRASVEKGLNLLVFPGTCRTDRSAVPMTFLRQVFDLLDVTYGEWTRREVEFPEDFGGGRAAGLAADVRAAGAVLLRDAAGQPLLVRRPMGRGAVLLAGYDNRPDSLDGAIHHERDEHAGHHTLARLLRHLGIRPREIDSGQLYVFKEMVHRGDRDYALFFSHVPATVEARLRVRLSRPSRRAYDLSTGETFDVAPERDGWHGLRLPILPRQGRYLSFHDRDGAGTPAGRETA